jgi:trans-aconitate 2-methyltransferase
MSSVREWNSESYHRISNIQFNWGTKVLDRLALRGDELILDAGCGSGRVTAVLARRLPRGRVIGVDLSENMLRTGQQTYADAALRNVATVCASLTALPLRPRFDGVFSNAAFHWVLDPDRLFRELFSVLKPGGWLEAQCGGGPNLARMLGEIGKLMSREPYAPFFADWRESWLFADPETTMLRLEAAGFVEIHTSLEAATCRLATPEEFRQFSSTVTLKTHLACIPDADLREQFLDDSTAIAEEKLKFELDYWRLNISARKPQAA